MVAILALLTVAVFITVDGVLRLLTRKARAAGVPSATHPPALDPGSLPAGVFVHPGHTWVEVLRSGMVCIGLDGFVGGALGGSGRLVLPDPGAQVRQGELLLTVEQDGRQLQVCAPLSGVVRNCNQMLAGDRGGLGRATSGARWLCTLSPSRLGDEISSLKVGETANSWLADEVRRLADWLGLVGQVRPGVAMQDGGVPVYGALNQVDTEAWKQFQSQFLDRGLVGGPS